MDVPWLQSQGGQPQQGPAVAAAELPQVSWHRVPDSQHQILFKVLCLVNLHLAVSCLLLVDPSLISRHSRMRCESAHTNLLAQALAIYAAIPLCSKKDRQRQSSCIGPSSLRAHGLVEEPFSSNAKLSWYRLTNACLHPHRPGFDPASAFHVRSIIVSSAMATARTPLLLPVF